MQRGKKEIIVLRPTQRFLAFLAETKPELSWVDLSEFQLDTTAYALPQHETDDELLLEMERNFPQMFRHEVARWLGDRAARQLKGSFFDFLCFFKFELHTRLVQLQ